MLQEEVVMAGFGGQGVMFMGKFLANIAMEEGKKVTYLPSYGAEVRGGTANCTVIISNREIASPVSSHPTAAIIMNKPSLDKFEPRLREGALLILNSSLISRDLQRDDLEVIRIPVTAISDELGNSRAANMVALGVYLARRDLVSIEKAVSFLKNVLPARWHDLLKLNEEALYRGANFLANSLSPAESVE